MRKRREYLHRVRKGMMRNNSMHNVRERESVYTQCKKEKRAIHTRKKSARTQNDS